MSDPLRLKSATPAQIRDFLAPGYRGINEALACERITLDEAQRRTNNLRRLEAQYINAPAGAPYGKNTSNV